MALSLLNPIIRVRTPDDVSRAGLPEILELCRRGSLLDLPGMRADQRAPVVTTLAVILHLEDRYGTKVEDVVSLDLVGDFAVPAFLQPALTGPTKSLPMTDLDHTTTGVAQMRLIPSRRSSPSSPQHGDRISGREESAARGSVS